MIALGKAAGPMLEVLLDRMKRRKGLRGICCSKYLPKKRNWRFRYFEGGHPLPNEDSFAAARAALALLKKAKKDTLIFFLISGGGSAMFDLPLDPQIGLDDTIAFHQALLASGAPINEINTLRKHFSAVKGGRLAIAAPEATKVSLLLPDVPLRSLDALSSGPTSPDHSTVADVREVLAKYDLAREAAGLVSSLLRARRSAGVARQQGLAAALSSQAAVAWSRAARRVTAAAAMTGEDEAFRDSVFELLLSSHDLVENARALAREGRLFCGRGQLLRRLGLCRCGALPAGALPRFAQPHTALLPDLRRRGDGHAGPHAGRRRPQPAVRAGMRAGTGEASGRAAHGAQRGLRRHRRQHADRRSHRRPHHGRRARAPSASIRKQSLRAFNACPLFTALGDAVVTGPTGQNLRDLRLLMADNS